MMPTGGWRSSAIVVFALCLSSCGRNTVDSKRVANRAVLTDQQVASIENKKIFFGHQSVGTNIIQGLRDLMARDARLKLKIVSSADPELVPGPALVESLIGQNGNPRSKDEAFAAILDKGLGRQGGIAMYKYCYVDIDSSTNVQQMFENYGEGIAALRVKYPALKIVHITVPLTTVEPAARAWVKTLLGRATERDANAKRNEFNRRLRQTYAGRDPIFDLAEGESTSPEGARSYFIRDNEKVYTLASEYTTDGGHLNEAGRLALAERLLLLLASIR
jgi:lysophospholipase L1-like esterase